MSVRRHGSPNGLWNNVSVATNDVSNPVYIGRGTSDLTLYVTTSAAATFEVEAAPVGALSSEGNEPELNQTAPTTWFTVWYCGTANGGNSNVIQVATTGAGSVAAIIPDFISGWVRLKRTDVAAAVTVTAGWEAQSDS